MVKSLSSVGRNDTFSNVPYWDEIFFVQTELLLANNVRIENGFAKRNPQQLSGSRRFR